MASEVGEMRRFSPREIESGGEKYSFSAHTNDAVKALTVSLAKVGQLSPLLLIEEESSLTCAAGNLRLNLLKETGETTALARIVSERGRDLFDLLLEEALQGGPLNPASVGLYLKKRMAAIGESAGDIPAGVLEKLGLTPRPGAVDDPLWIASLPHEDLMRFATGEVAAKGIRILSAAPREDALTVLEFTRGTRLGGNKFYEVAKNMLECAWRDDLSVKEWIVANDLEKFRGEGEPLRQELFTRRYPKIATWLGEFEGDVKKLKLPKGVNLTHSQGFEGGLLRLTLAFGSLGDLGTTLEELSERFSEGDFDALEKYLG